MSKKLRMESIVEIVKAYVAGNEVSVEELPRLFMVVYDSVCDLERPTGKGEEDRLEPAAAVPASLERSRLVCLEDGKKFKSLKRHLRAAHGLSPDEYRAKWGLDDDYPLVAPASTARRSKMAVKMGLGRRRRSTSQKRAGKRRLTDAA